jgi:hypothetical protein
VSGELFGLICSLCDFDASAFASATGMNLCFDDNGSPELFGGPARFLFSVSNFATRNAHAVARKNLLGLVFMNLHRATSKRI